MRADIARAARKEGGFLARAIIAVALILLLLAVT